MGQLRIMEVSGDIKVSWNPSSTGEVALARKQFEDALKKGFTAFVLKYNWQKGRLLTEFDPDEESVILVPPLSGG